MHAYSPIPCFWPTTMYQLVCMRYVPYRLVHYVRMRLAEHNEVRKGKAETLSNKSWKLKGHCLTEPLRWRKMRDPA